MNSPNPSSKNIEQKKQAVQEPQSAHATPVVEAYIKNRNKKAEKQIRHEVYGNLNHNRF
jgi:hypothetical protein